VSQDSKLDFGSVQVHKTVLAELIYSAAQGIDGIRLIQKSMGQRLLELFGQQKFPGIEIKVDDVGDISLEVKVFVRYGINIPDAARQAQEAIKKAIEKTIDIRLKNININVQGMERGE